MGSGKGDLVIQQHPQHGVLVLINRLQVFYLPHRLDMGPKRTGARRGSGVI
jgi:hypothetical protein